MNERNAAARIERESEIEGQDIGADTTDTAIEERATRLGWSPRDKFRGDPDRWMPAKEYVERGEQLLPIMVERSRRLDDALSTSERERKKLADQVGEISGKLDEAVSTFREFRTATSNVEQRAYDRAKAELKAERDAAVAAADPAAFKAADTALEELEKTKPAPVEQRREPEKREPEKREPEKIAAPEQPKISQYAQTWIDENAWFKADNIAGAKAVALHGSNIAMGMSEEDSLADVRASMEVLRPDLFENTQRRAAPTVIAPSGNGRRPRGGGRTFDDLPQDARDAFKRFQKLDPDFTKEAYLRDYFGNENT